MDYPATQGEKRNHFHFLAATTILYSNNPTDLYMFLYNSVEYVAEFKSSSCLCTSLWGGASSSLSRYNNMSIIAQLCFRFLFQIDLHYTFLKCEVCCRVSNQQSATCLCLYDIYLQFIMDCVAWNGVLLLIGGGVMYTAGVPFFVSGFKHPIRHAVWHLFVVLASMLHFFRSVGLTSIVYRYFPWTLAGTSLGFGST